MVPSSINHSYYLTSTAATLRFQSPLLKIHPLSVLSLTACSYNSLPSPLPHPPFLASFNLYCRPSPTSPILSAPLVHLLPRFNLADYFDYNSPEQFDIETSATRLQGRQLLDCVKSTSYPLKMSSPKRRIETDVSRLGRISCYSSTRKDS